MKFICTQENLVQGLGRVVPLAGKNAQLPILSHIKLQLTEGVLQLTGTDLEIGIQAIVPGKVDEEGSCTVPARRFLDYVQQLPKSDPLELTLREMMLHLETPHFHAKFPIGNEEDFPLLPRTRGSQIITQSAALLCQAFTRTLFSAARDTTRPEIHSVLITGESQAIRVAATDGFRLAEEIIPLTEEQEVFSLLIPLSTTQEIVRLFSEQKEIKLLPAESQVNIEGEGIQLSSRLVDGNYPDYQQIIPQSFKTEGILDRQEVVRALKTLSVFLPRESRRVTLSVNPESESIVFSVAGSEAGEGRVEVACEAEGDEVEVLFNIQYLLEGLQSMPGKQCSFGLSGSRGAAAFKPLIEGVQYTYVVMPIQA